MGPFGECLQRPVPIPEFPEQLPPSVGKLGTIAETQVFPILRKHLNCSLAFSGSREESRLRDPKHDPIADIFRQTRLVEDLDGLVPLVKAFEPLGQARPDFGDLPGFALDRLGQQLYGLGDLPREGQVIGLEDQEGRVRRRNGLEPGDEILDLSGSLRIELVPERRIFEAKSDRFDQEDGSPTASPAALERPL